VRTLGEELGVSKSTEYRILAQAKLQPHRLKRYIASNDPEFEALWKGHAVAICSA
jgi:hypothetical protein